MATTKLRQHFLHAVVAVVVVVVKCAVVVGDDDSSNRDQTNAVNVDNFCGSP